MFTGQPQGLFFRGYRFTNTLSFLAYLDLILSLMAPPGIAGAPEWLKSASMGFQLIIYLIMLVALLFRLKFMWGSKAKWFDGAREPRWLIVQSIVLFLLTPAQWLAQIAPNNEVLQVHQPRASLSQSLPLLCSDAAPSPCRLAAPSWTAQHRSPSLFRGGVERGP